MLSKWRDIFLDFGLEYWKRYYSSYRGTVGNTDDPENRGRIQIYVPSIYGANLFKYWALPKGMYSGNGIGFYAMPNEGDNIWVEFEGGDARRPIWDYGHWNKDKGIENVTPEKKIFQTTTGLKLIFDDEAGQIDVIGKDDFKLTLNSAGVHLGKGGAEQPILLGDSTVTELNKLSVRVTAIINAFTTAPVTPNDGGATFKAALIAATSIPPTESWTGVKSQNSKTD